MTDLKKALEILKKYNIKNEKELEKELEKNPINIGIFVAPIKNIKGDQMNIGVLSYNEFKRYCIKDKIYFTSGDPIEIFYEGEWLKGKIEHSFSMDDYYFTDDSESYFIYNLTGCKARYK